jgi:hypothetical protein
MTHVASSCSVAIFSECRVNAAHPLEPSLRGNRPRCTPVSALSRTRHRDSGGRTIRWMRRQMDAGHAIRNQDTEREF